MALVSSVSVASKARKADRSIGLPVAARGALRGAGSAALAVPATASRAAGRPKRPASWSRSSVPGTLQIDGDVGPLAQRGIDMPGHRSAEAP